MKPTTSPTLRPTLVPTAAPSSFAPTTSPSSFAPTVAGFTYFRIEQTRNDYINLVEIELYTITNEKIPLSG